MLIHGIYDVNIFIDDLDILSTSGTILNYAKVYESVMRSIPTCELEVVLPVDWIDYRTLVDGTKIKFIVKSTLLNIDETWVFRLYNIKKININQNFATIFIEGVIDFYDGYQDANRFNLKAPSSNVFKQIANTYGLQCEIDNTNDSQLWTAGQLNTYQFFNKMCAYAYVDEMSGMFWCLDRQKRLIYKNITSLFRNRQNNIYKFVQTIAKNKNEKTFGYSTVKASIQAGTNNLKNDGYGGDDICFDLLSYSYKRSSSKKVVAESNLINISKELSKGLSQDWFPMDVGNFHPKYYDALKQNRRILSTYSSYLALESQFFEPYRLGQVVQFDYTDSQNQDFKFIALSGTFMIDAIAITITRQNVTSALELVMQGLNGTAVTREVY